MSKSMEVAVDEKKLKALAAKLAKHVKTEKDLVITLFDYPREIRKAIYTTNAIESLNSVIRHATDYQAQTTVIFG